MVKRILQNISMFSNHQISFSKKRNNYTRDMSTQHQIYNIKGTSPQHQCWIGIMASNHIQFRGVTIYPHNYILQAI